MNNYAFSLSLAPVSADAAERYHKLLTPLGEILEFSAKQVVLDAGCEVYVPTSEELAAFQAACQPVYAQVVEEGICTQAELDEMLAIIAAVRGE